ncbi:MAG: hypothetical protein RL701_6555 [Pseudomonadota bacterium]
MEIHDSAATQLVASQFQVLELGRASQVSPLAASGVLGDFVDETTRVLVSAETTHGMVPDAALSFEKAGARRQLFFTPERTRVGIVSCGGLCPGINSVIRALVLQLHHSYGVKHIVGFRYGYEGLNKLQGLEPMTLTPSLVTNSHVTAGSILGLGRGPQSPAAMLARLQELAVDVLIVVGGDGSLRGAHAIAVEAARVGAPIGIVAVPKTIDNDIPFVDKTFGFESAVEVASRALSSAHVEATSARNGIGIVKLMGRDAGFLCAHAALASLDVNFCLIPEVRFELDGPCGLLRAVEARLEQRGHALIAVAEGCGANLMNGAAEYDASGNLRFGSQELDIGAWLRDQLHLHFKARNMQTTIKYIDPSYMVRSVAANSADNRYCDLLAHHAVHAALAGKTDLVVGSWNGSFTHVPLALVNSQRRRVDPDGDLWSAVVSSTGQFDLCAAKLA